MRAIPRLSAAPPVPALMVQGVSSNAGKSLLTAALCRLLTRRGIKTAPFKAQNMALNSFVTDDGKEMARAQALQAAACGLSADVRMNPVLLKPTSHTGAQIIVMGEPVGQMRVREYHLYKTKAWRAVRKAYKSLCVGKDVMVLEGAGSPAEINLKAHDIVNMRMARLANARVLLVADIDRGGAFAALVGTMSLLGRADRARVAGYVLNKFRGDATLLTSALTAVSRRTRRPFLGVIPMLKDLHLPEEDSVSFKLGTMPGLFTSAGPDKTCPTQTLDIAVTDLPHISNFTDLDALRAEHGVRVRLLRRAEDFGVPHAVILPGSKNTVADMRFLQKTGLAEAICRFSEQDNATVVGICGGLQMLGQRIDDPLCIEDGGRAAGLGLLPLRTRLREVKQLRRVAGRMLETVAGTALSVEGYEIRHGQSEPTSRRKKHDRMAPVMKDTAGRVLGWGRLEPDGRARVWGAYLHGLFDADAFRHAFLNSLREKACFAPQTGCVYSLVPELDRLADVVEQNLNMRSVYSLLGI